MAKAAASPVSFMIRITPLQHPAFAFTMPFHQPASSSCEIGIHIACNRRFPIPVGAIWGLGQFAQPPSTHLTRWSQFALGFSRR
jgi:hypothetical protein